MGTRRRLRGWSWLVPAIGFVMAALAAAREAAAVPWVRSYDAPRVRVQHVDALPDGRILMLGACDACWGGGFGTWLGLANGDGTLAWQESLPRLGMSLRAVRVPSGGWILPFGRALVRLGEDGTVLWAREGDGVTLSDAAVRGDGTIVVVGNVVVGRDPRDREVTTAWAGVIDDAGNLASQASFVVGNMGTRFQLVAGTGTGVWAAGVAADYDDPNIGEFMYSAIVIRLDETLNVAAQWQRAANMYNAPSCQQLTALQGGGFAVVFDEWLVTSGGARALVADADGRPVAGRSDRFGYCDFERAPIRAMVQARDGTLLLMSEACASGRLTRENAAGQPVWTLDDGSTISPFSIPVPLADGEILVPDGYGARIMRLSAEGRVSAPCLSLSPTSGGDALEPDTWTAPAQPATDGGVTAGLVPMTIVALPTSFALLPDCDNCPGIPNDQSDADGDLVGDACDACPDLADPGQADADADGIGDACDACSDTDGDGLGATGAAPETCAMDTCPDVTDASNADTDADGRGDACDDCPLVADGGVDGDRDGLPDACDACPLVRDDQADTDGDGAGDACDACPLLGGDQSDADSDAVGDACDDCPDLLDPDQRDTDGDGTGDLCDACPAVADDQSDADGDGAGDACDDCASPDPAQADCDGDGIGEACQAGDADGDGFPNDADLCPCLLDASQRDRDADGIGDACDPCPDLADNGLDTDGDLAGDACDPCPFEFDRAPADRDADGRGDACDNCPDDVNRAQEDEDGDGIGDACESATEVAPMDVDPFAQPLRLMLGPGVRLTWPDAAESRYDVYRGTVQALASGRYDHAPVACGITSLETDVPDEPGSFYYLVSSRDGRLESSLGRDSFGNERPGAPRVCP